LTAPMSLLLSVLVGMCSIGWGSAYSIGNISVVCDTMMPGHGYVPQNTPPPFRITASNTTYAPGDTITGQSCLLLLLTNY
uniref:Reelin domain-containing protein n=1 Tax=Astyanax mexicanus TaxID=7994 RepID=A0A3B1IL89_ASTMX